MTSKRPDRVTGGNHDIFWAWCAKGELHLPRCTRCSALAWPITRTCDHCGGDAFVWERMSGNGHIVSWCSFQHDYYAGLFPLPHDVILVELAEGVVFISNPAGFDVDAITPDMAVKVVFLPCEDSHGPFQLPVFERA